MIRTRMAARSNEDQGTKKEAAAAGFIILKVDCFLVSHCGGVKGGKKERNCKVEQVYSDKFSHFALYFGFFEKQLNDHFAAGWIPLLCWCKKAFERFQDFYCCGHPSHTYFCEHHYCTLEMCNSTQ